MKPTKIKLKKELRRLRHIVDSEQSGTIESRLAYVAECSILWATASTVGWPNPSKDVLEQSRILMEELRGKK